MSSYHISLICVLCLCIGALANPHGVISGPEDIEGLINVIYNSWYFTFDIDLQTDLDFSNDELKNLLIYFPLGRVESDCIPYTGVFEGNNHTVKNLVMDRRNSDDGWSSFFCGFSNATVRNLNFDSSCQFTGTYAGALSGYVSGDVNLENIEVSATVTGTYAGGLLGYAYLDGNTITLDSTVNNGGVFSTDNGSVEYAGGLWQRVDHFGVMWTCMCKQQ